MNLNAALNSKVGGYIALGCLGAAVVWYLSKKAGAAAGAVGEAFNPASDKNLANRAVTAVGSKITGDDNWSLGGSLYDLTHNDGPMGKGTGGFDWSIFNPAAWAGEQAAEATDFDISKAVGDWKWIDMDFSNPISEGVNSAGAKISGDSSWNLGGWIYDIFHPQKTASASEWDNDYTQIKYNNGEGIN